MTLVYFIKTVWDFTFLKTLKEKQNFNLHQTNSICKVILLNTSFGVQDVCQVNISGDWYEVYVYCVSKYLRLGISIDFFIQ